MIARRDALVLAAAAVVRPALAQAPVPRSELREVATYEQQGTGVACSKDGRIFICFPRWEQDVTVSVAELKNGQLVPYPNMEWNAWRNAKPLTPKDHFICVQSVTVDPQGYLWIVDPAAPGLEFIIPEGPKLLKVDLRTDKVVQAIHFGLDAAPQGSYMNDVRVSPDGRWAYLTDSGAKGALVVVDLRSGKAKRVLDGDPRTQAQPGVNVVVNGQELRRPDGRGVQFNADSLALSNDGKTVYWQPLVGKTLYSAETASLQAGHPNVRTVGPADIADGYWIARDGRFYATSPQDNSVKLRGSDDSLQIVVQDPKLLWPDSMAEMPDGTLLVTASDIQDMAQWHAKGSTRTQPYKLFKFSPPPR
jgi:sugar lactone lactonase YvrE